MATKKVYLVDTENVGSTWKDLLPAKAGTDQILLFFTENSPYVSYSDLQLILQFPDRFEMIKCNPGKNGLDFQLVSYLGYLIKTASKAHYVIVSNDGGFDAVVKFWQDRGMSVSRMNVYHVLRPDAAQSQENAPAPAEAQAPVGRRGRTAASVKKTVTLRARKTVQPHSAVSFVDGAAPDTPVADAAAADTAAQTPKEELSGTGTENAADAEDNTSVKTNAGISPENASQENSDPPATVTANAKDDATAQDAAEAKSDTATQGAPKGSSGKTTRTSRKKAAASADSTVQTDAAKVPAKAPLTQPLELSVPDSENMELDFSNLTVSEKAALLRKYLPKEFSEHQESLDIISDIMFGHDTTNHHQLHLAFVKNFGDEKGTLIYKAFRPHLAEFRA